MEIAFKTGARVALAGVLTTGVAWTAIGLAGATLASGATLDRLYVATNGSDTGNACTSHARPCATIQHAIDQAQSNSYIGDHVIIEVASGTYDENDVISFFGVKLTIDGSGAPTTVVDGRSAGSVFTIDRGVVTIRDLTITDGKGTYSGGVDNAGTVTLRNDTLSRNLASWGGGLYNDGTATLRNDTLVDDVATFTGGGVYTFGLATLVNDTLAYDGAGSVQGGGAIDNGREAVLRDDTLLGDTSGGGISNYGTYGRMTITDSILDGSICHASAPITDGGHNVESEDSCGFGPTSVINSTNINLSLDLAPNGSGGPETLAIGANSSAFEEVPLGSCAVRADERGDPRPGVPGQSCDAGAFEYQG